MIAREKANKITATLKLVVTEEFYDDEASEETLRSYVEQCLEESGFSVEVELFKVQEPRVLTLEEIDSLANKREETVVYLERRWDTNIYGAIAGHCNGGLPNLSCIGTMRNVVQQYNQAWRCWSARPTDEQREAAPWME